MQHLLTLERPVPSIPTYGIQYNSGEWTYQYIFYGKIPGYLYNGLQSLMLKQTQQKNTVNLYVESEEQLKDLLENQTREDLRLRGNFSSQGKPVAQFTVQNKAQTIKALIVDIKEQERDTTTFIGRKL